MKTDNTCESSERVTEKKIKTSSSAILLQKVKNLFAEGMCEVEIAQELEKDESWVKNSLLLLKLPEKVLDAIGEGVLPRSVAIQLLSVHSSRIESVVDATIQLFNKVEL